MSISTLISRWFGKHAAPAQTTTVPTEEPPMATPTPNVAVPTLDNPTATVPGADQDVFLDKLKAVLTTAGHDVEAVWDEAVALAKKLV